MDELIDLEFKTSQAHHESQGTEVDWDSLSWTIKEGDFGKSCECHEHENKKLASLDAKWVSLRREEEQACMCKEDVRSSAMRQLVGDPQLLRSSLSTVSPAGVGVVSAEEGDTTNSVNQIEAELAAKVAIHEEKHPGGKLPTELRSIAAYKMFKQGVPGFKCVPK